MLTAAQELLDRPGVAKGAARAGIASSEELTRGSVLTLKAYKYALNPTPRQGRLLDGHCAAARLAFNWALGWVKANLDQRAAERSYGIPDELLTPAISWTMYSLRKAWNQAKARVAPWWAEYSKEAYASGLTQLAAALKNWGESRKGKRRGRAMGFPRFRSKRKAVKSCRFTTGTIGCEERYAVLPRIGRIRLHETPAPELLNGTARIMAATIRFERGRWFVSFTVEQKMPAQMPRRPDAVVGVDLGIKSLAMLAGPEGEPQTVPNPKHLDAALRKLGKLSRRVSRRVGPDRRSGRIPSNRWKRANAQRNRVHHTVAYQRADALHKLTTDIARKYGTVVMEDLNVAGMLRNRRLARRIGDAGFGEIRRQLAYKTQWNGGRLVVADRWFPSSKTCSGCGVVKAKLLLSERNYNCESCGLVMDRDENAARNLAALAVAASGAETLNGRRADQRTRATGQVAVKRLPGSRERETGTASPEAVGE
ncbi:putative transposase [Kribbella sp. VKM Ac-2571]|uniref:IS607 family element RNA-guided endonuclease TnpB n=1 Tax=Kribbella sp. VKM Ac-2571 TaxID=2512222 RepID=UPI0010E3A355|nr:IS607 family element RNA-guided endonuclease TnpB [Kribbella sp. VKM Ac-2571]TDO47057.1 putative transposase [Kribbella sp. VKM Ac-2571]